MADAAQVPLLERHVSDQELNAESRKTEAVIIRSKRPLRWRVVAVTVITVVVIVVILLFVQDRTVKPDPVNGDDDDNVVFAIRPTPILSSLSSTTVSTTFTIPVTTGPTTSTTISTSASTSTSSLSLPSSTTPDANLTGYDLRILPLGDSITYGYQSTDGNGYRKPLYDLLAADNIVSMHGTQHSGNMTHNAHEGHMHRLIEQISDVASLSSSTHPNLILVHVGSNDMGRNHDVKNAPERLNWLIARVAGAHPGAVILVAQILPSRTAYYQKRIDAFNRAVPGVVRGWVERAQKVHVVDMSRAVNTRLDMADSYHPNDGGYQEMAGVWYEGIREVQRLGWLRRNGRG